MRKDNNMNKFLITMAACSLLLLAGGLAVATDPGAGQGKEDVPKGAAKTYTSVRQILEGLPRDAQPLAGPDLEEKEKKANQWLQENVEGSRIQLPWFMFREPPSLGQATQTTTLGGKEKASFKASDFDPHYEVQQALDEAKQALQVCHLDEADVKIFLVKRVVSLYVNGERKVDSELPKKLMKLTPGATLPVIVEARLKKIQFVSGKDRRSLQLELEDVSIR
jgi:hypothetical protein